MLIKKIYILLMFQNITQIMKKKVIFLMMSKGEIPEAKYEGFKSRTMMAMALFCSKKNINIIKRNNIKE